MGSGLRLKTLIGIAFNRLKIQLFSWAVGLKFKTLMGIVFNRHSTVLMGSGLKI